MPDLTLLAEELKRDEGLRLKAYRDSVGKLTIGVGRNLDDKGITEDEALYLLATDIAEVCEDLDRSLSWWRGLSENRQRVIANMCFNMGIDKLMGFKNTLKAIQESRWQDATQGMLDSKWASQVGVRAERLAQMMLNG